jgi:hypothetical protein
VKKLCVKSIVLFLFLIAPAAYARAQNDCGWTRQSAPVFLNLRLGMTAVEVRNALGNSLKIKFKTDDDYRFFQNFIEKAPPADLKGVRAVYLRFYRKALYQIEIFYDENQYPQTLENFIAAISAQIDSPVSEFKVNNNRAELKCGETALVADVILNPRVELTDEAKRAEIEESRAREKN